MSVTDQPDSDPELDNARNLQQNNVFDRSAPVRSTVARKCREFYIRRLEKTETLQRRWSMCSPIETDSEGAMDCNSSDPESSTEQSDQPRKPLTPDDNGSDPEENAQLAGSSPVPLRKWKSTFHLAMDNLRREITSMITQDNDLFKQLLSLNDSIAELRDQQRRSLELSKLEDEDEDDFTDCSRSPSLESLSDPDTNTTASPASTMSSSCSSHCTNPTNNINANNSRRHCTPSNPSRNHHHHSCHGDDKKRSLSGSNLICLRCHSNGKAAAPLYNKRKSQSYLPTHWRREEFDSYDSGIHLQGSHSDSEHEIFV